MPQVLVKLLFSYLLIIPMHDYSLALPRHENRQLSSILSFPDVANPSHLLSLSVSRCKCSNIPHCAQWKRPTSCSSAHPTPVLCGVAYFYCSCSRICIVFRVRRLQLALL